jgi:hypothetical protein
MQSQDFYKLGRPVQDRLIGCIGGTGLPAPILASRGGPLEPFVWLLAAGGTAILLIVLYRIGLGALDSGMAIQGAALILLYALLVGAMTFAFVRAAALFADIRSLPFKPGVYLFPIGVIDARRYVLKIYPIDELVSSQGPTPSHGFRITMKGGATFDFTAKNAEAAAKAAEGIAGARGQLAAAEDAPGSMRPKALASLDPLQGFVNPLAPTTSIERTVPPWAKFAWAIAPAVGLILGVCIWLVRNVVSDDRMFARATAAGDAESLRAYMARGSRHKGEIEVVLLPRAELKEAQAKGTVDAMEEFIKAHPKTGIAAEIDAALKKAMAAELEDAKKAGTLSALKEFAKRHPNHKLEGDLKAAMHAVYVAALDNYKKNEAPKDVSPATLAFVERLVTWAETKGPKVEVRFHRRGNSLDKADTLIGKNKYFMGVVSFATRYEDAAHMKPREDELGATIVARFNQAFPKDILQMSVGEAIADPETPLPPVTVPTWFIDYIAEWDGGLKTSDKPRGVFAGVGYSLDASFRMPDDSVKPLRYKPGIIWRGPKLEGLEDVDKPEEKIYADMAIGAFEQYGKKLLGTMFAVAK